MTGDADVALGSQTMTEEEWLDSTDPSPMLEFLRGKASDTRFRLFACACVRRQVWHLLDTRGREAVNVSDRLAQGQASLTELNTARAAMNTAFHTTHEKAAKAATKATSMTLWATADAIRIARHIRDALGQPDRNTARRDQVALTRDIFGNPFHPISLDPTWLTSTVVRLAQAIYEERELPSGHLDQGRLGILADALEEVGCTQREILEHCRSEGPHVRGCWVIDLLLGKE
ncbi:hypothetical protein AYO40_00500 [Planctomycetaceae bacterium SCGC AG-212-D15]|nr:hypothetical protein AYO40_00500 [Planctomycetaceae bacterium SCGC AG-212-D15]